MRHNGISRLTDKSKIRGSKTPVSATPDTEAGSVFAHGVLLKQPSLNIKKRSPAFELWRHFFSNRYFVLYADALAWYAVDADAPAE